jgi:hypothetical protein
VASAVATLQDLKTELCGLDTEERVERCQRLRSAFEPGDERRATVIHFEVHALRACDRPGDALEVIAEELSHPLSPGAFATLLIFKALSLYDLGQLHLVGPVCEKIPTDAAPDVHAHRLALEAILQAHAGDPGAGDAFDYAIAYFEAHLGDRYTESISWVRMEAAVWAKRTGRFALASRYCEGVAYPDYLVTAALIRAEMLLDQGLPADDLLVQVEAAALDQLQQIRLAYVQAYNLARRGLLDEAGAKITYALRLLSDRGPGRRIERDVLDGLSRLRASLVADARR